MVFTKIFELLKGSVPLGFIWIPMLRYMVIIIIMLLFQSRDRLQTSDSVARRLYELTPADGFKLIVIILYIEICTNTTALLSY